MSQLLGQLAKLAAHADAPALDDSTARRMVDAALVRAALADARPAPRRRATWWPALAFAAATLIAAFVLRPRAQPAEPALLHVALPTGDRLSGTAGARFDIEELAPASRRLRLHTGTMVFDVAHVVADQRFEVATRDAVIVATGTVFSVATDARGTHVHVYEGSVAIRAAGRTTPLPAGADWQTAPLRDSPQIVEAGEAAARERARIVVTPIAAPAPVAAAAPAAAAAPVAAAAPAPVPAPARAAAPAPARAAAPAPVPAPVPVPAATSEPSPVAAPEPAARPDPLAAARADIAAARYTAALTKVTAAPHPLTGPWLLLEADALRGLGEPRQAADALAAAVPLLDGAEQAEAAYSAAYLRFHDVKDGEGALAVLAAGDADIPGSLFEERGLALHVEILVAQGKRGEARPLAQRYLDRFPHGELRSLMHQLVETR